MCGGVFEDGLLGNGCENVCVVVCVKIGSFGVLENGC